MSEHYRTNTIMYLNDVYYDSENKYFDPLEDLAINLKITDINTNISKINECLSLEEYVRLSHYLTTSLEALRTKIMCIHRGTWFDKLNRLFNLTFAQFKAKALNREIKAGCHYLKLLEKATQHREFTVLSNKVFQQIQHVKSSLKLQTHPISIDTLVCFENC